MQFSGMGGGGGAAGNKRGFNIVVINLSFSALGWEKFVDLVE